MIDMATGVFTPRLVRQSVCLSAGWQYHSVVLSQSLCCHLVVPPRV